MRRRIFLISLGCVKNLVDSEHMLGLLKSRGFEVVSGVEKAQIIIINTCGFIRPAVEEAIDTILEAVDLKRRGKVERVVVTGCFVQRYGYKLQREIPEVDGWLGTGEILRIVKMLENDSNYGGFYISRPTFVADHSIPRIQTTPFYSSYLRVAEGCSHRCSYCMIPSLRGPFRSRRLDSLIAEAEEMALNGVKEINLIAQDTTMYGKDFRNGTSLIDLLERLTQIKEIRWIRLLYSHPSGVSDRLLELIDSEEAICPYLDLPFQHVNKFILKTMRRDAEGESPFNIIRRIRSTKRKISLRSSFITGFPGESREMFEELLDFIEWARFDHLGVFVFSPEKGTRAARIGTEVERAEAESRRDEIMRLQSTISENINLKLLGTTVPVLIEGPSPETDLLLKGRTVKMAPEVDGQVLINKGTGITGEIMNVLISEAYPYDLIGEIIE